MADNTSPAKPAAEVLEIAADPVADIVNPEIVADAPVVEPVADTPAAPKPAPLSSREARMKEIADKIKAKRAGENAPDTTLDYSDPTQMYGGIAKPPVAEAVPEPSATPAGEPQPQPAADAPRKFKIKVRREDHELTEDELIAAAQKGLAGDSYLDEARRIRDQADEALKAARAPASRPHPGDSSAQPDEPVPEPSADDPHQEAVKLIEDIQLGDPNEAATKLVAFLDKKTAQTSRTALIEAKVNDDWADTQAAFKKFKDANPDLVRDPDAEAVIRDRIIRGYRDDLVAVLDVTPDKLPTDPDQLADAHRMVRVRGLKVRSPEQLLEDAKQGFLQQWRGSAPAPQDPTTLTPAPRAETPRVLVDRDGRRQAIPTQPTRSSAPPSQVPGTAPKTRTRQDTINEMKKARGQITAA